MLRRRATCVIRRGTLRAKTNPAGVCWAQPATAFSVGIRENVWLSSTVGNRSA